MIECVNIENNHLFYGNPILEQHKLRHESIIKRQKWDVPAIRGMEYDSYDNPSAYYFIKRNTAGKAIGVARLCPTDRPYMLEQDFSYLFTKSELPKSSSVWEGSRFCIDSSLPALERKKIMHELVIGYLEFALANNIKSIIGIMYPVYWKNIFIKSGWNVDWLGDVHISDEGHKIIAGDLKISSKVLANVRNITGLKTTILNFGHENEIVKKAA